MQASCSCAGGYISWAVEPIGCGREAGQLYRLYKGRSPATLPIRAHLEEIYQAGRTYGLGGYICAVSAGRTVSGEADTQEGRQAV